MFQIKELCKVLVWAVSPQVNSMKCSRTGVSRIWPMVLCHLACSSAHGSCAGPTHLMWCVPDYSTCCMQQPRPQAHVLHMGLFWHTLRARLVQSTCGTWGQSGPNWTQPRTAYLTCRASWVWYTWNRLYPLLFLKDIAPVENTAPNL